jgi:transcriptional regulator with XRE-family HTH domain
MKTVSAWLQERGMEVDQLIAATKLDPKRVKAIVSGNYTPSPSDRQRLAAALGVSIDQIAWDHSIGVQHLRGNGPQSGRST